MTVRGSRLLLFSGAAVMMAGLIVAAILDPRVAGGGWLIGFVFWAQILLGSMSLIMIHRLTAGRWGEIIAPVTEPICAALPLIVVLAVPIFVAVHTLYPWSRHDPSVKPEVLSVYLNDPAFMVRSIVALVGWSLLAFFLPRVGGARGQLLAALGLVFHAVAISFVSIDWYLTLDAPFTSSSFGASVAISSLAAAIGWAAIWMPASQNDPAIGDVGALMLTTVLGLTYIDFMAVLVIWYGDLPRESAWFAERDHFPWSALSVIAFMLVSVIPTLALIQSKFRNVLRPVRVIGGVILCGTAVYDAYLIAPVFGPVALVTSLLAIFGIGFVLVGIGSFLAAGEAVAARETVNGR